MGRIRLEFSRSSECRTAQTGPLRGGGRPPSLQGEAVCQDPAQPLAVKPPRIICAARPKRRVPRARHPKEGPAGGVSGGLPTVRSALAAHCQAAALCLTCDHIRNLDLRELATRHADTALVELPLRCQGCGARRFRIIVSGRLPGENAAR
jgi:hypothetical protein